MEKTTYERLIENFEYLNLKEIVLHLKDVEEEFKNKDISLIEALVKLTDYEIEHKEKNLINSMIKIAGFPFIKDINYFDFSYQDNIDKQEMLDLLINKANKEGRLNERIKHYCKYRLLIIDELGYIPITKEETINK